MHVIMNVDGSQLRLSPDSYLKCVARPLMIVTLLPKVFLAYMLHDFVTQTFPFLVCDILINWDWPGSQATFATIQSICSAMMSNCSIVWQLKLYW